MTAERVYRPLDEGDVERFGRIDAHAFNMPFSMAHFSAPEVRAQLRGLYVGDRLVSQIAITRDRYGMSPAPYARRAGRRASEVIHSDMDRHGIVARMREVIRREGPCTRPCSPVMWGGCRQRSRKWRPITTWPARPRQEGRSPKRSCCRKKKGGAYFRMEVPRRPRNSPARVRVRASSPLQRSSGQPIPRNGSLPNAQKEKGTRPFGCPPQLGYQGDGPIA